MNEFVEKYNETVLLPYCKKCMDFIESKSPDSKNPKAYFDKITDTYVDNGFMEKFEAKLQVNMLDDSGIWITANAIASAVILIEYFSYTEEQVMALIDEQNLVDTVKQKINY